MKKVVFLILMFAFANICMFGQTSPDQSQVLQNCIKTPEIKDLLQKNTSNQIFIMQHGVQFPASLDLTIDGKKVVFLTKPDLYEKKIDAFFLFEKFEITGNTASVAFVYYYDYTSAFKMQKVVIELKKSGDSWSISSTKLEGK